MWNIEMSRTMPNGSETRWVKLLHDPEGESVLKECLYLFFPPQVFSKEELRRDHPGFGLAYLKIRGVAKTGEVRLMLACNIDAESAGFVP